MKAIVQPFLQFANDVFQEMLQSGLSEVTIGIFIILVCVIVILAIFLLAGVIKEIIIGIFTGKAIYCLIFSLLNLSLVVILSLTLYAFFKEGHVSNPSQIIIFITIIALYASFCPIFVKSLIKSLD